MCWAVPGRVIGILDDAMVRVDFGGVTREVLTGFESVRAGELVMVHSGVIIGKTSESEVVTNLGLFMEAEMVGLQDLGYSAEAARKMATDEFTTLVSSFGLEPSKYGMPVQNANARGPVEDENQAEPQVPEAAHREKFRTALSDMDYLQVMHYTNYFRLCERGWMGLLSKIGFSYSTLIHKYGIFVPTVETGGKILSPVRMDNDVEVAVWIEDMGKKHVKYRGVILNVTTHKLAADTYHVAVCTDTTLMESVELPKELVEKLTPFVVKQTKSMAD